MKETRLEKRVREDLRRVREAAGFSQEEVGDLFGWEKAAVSKIELGHRKIRLTDYMRIMDFCRGSIPGHPAIELIEFYLPKRGRSPTTYTAPDDDDET